MNYKKDALLNTTAVFMSLGFKWLMSVLAVRWGNFEQAGLLSLALSCANLYFPFATYSTRTVILADVKKEHSDAEYMLLRVITIGISLLACVIISVSLRYTREQLVTIIFYYIFILSEAAEDMLFGIFQRGGKLADAGAFGTGRAVVFFVVFIVSYKLSGNMVSSILCMMVASWIYIVIVEVASTTMAFAQSWKFKNVTKENIIQLLTVSTPIMVNALMLNWQSAVPRLVFQKMYDMRDMGIYASLANISLLLSIGMVCLLMPVVPKFSEFFLNRRLKKLMLLTIIPIGVVMVFGGIAIGLSKMFGKFVLELLFGAEAVLHIDSFYWLIFSVILYSIVLILVDLMVGMRLQKHLIICAIVGFIATAAVVVPLCKFFNMDGITFSMIAGYVCQIIYSIIICAFKFKEERKKL